MTLRNEHGTTVVEVIVAIVILTVGLLGLASSSATVTRMISRSQAYTEASALATQELELLHAQPCASLADGTKSVGMFQVGWAVDSIAAGEGRRIRMAVHTPTAQGMAVDSFTTSLSCRI